MACCQRARVLAFLFGVVSPAAATGTCCCVSAGRWRRAVRWTCRAGIVAALATGTVALAVLGSNLATHLH